MKAADFKSFLYFKNNRCWTQLYRRSLRLINDMEALRRAIAHLQDESIPVEIRLRDVLHGGSYWMNGLGINIATAILHICDQNDRYGVWNNRTEDALSKLGYLKQRVYDRGKDYLVINGCLHDLEADLRKCKPDLSIDLDFVDSFVWFISKDKLDYVEGTPRSEANFTIPPKPDLTIQSTSAPENLLSLINAFEKDVRNHVKERLGANYEKILNSTTPELVEKWHWRQRRDSENGKPTEPEIINYAEMGDYINILLRNRETFNKEGYFISDVITYLKKISYNRGKAAHPSDKPLDIQQIYATKDAIEWIQAWIRAK